MEEIWRVVEGYPSYSVSNLGRVKSLPRRGTLGGILTPSTSNTKGYARVRLCDGKYNTKHKSVHRLVAEAFIPNPLGKPEVNHINEVKTDNKATNLEWVTASENCLHGTRLSRIKMKQGKPVVGISEAGSLYYDSIADTKKDGFCPKRVSDACRGVIKKHRGYSWKYLEEATE